MGKVIYDPSKDREPKKSTIQEEGEAHVKETKKEDKAVKLAEKSKKVPKPAKKCLYGYARL